MKTQKKQVVANAINTYDDAQKQSIVDVCQSNLPFNEVLDIVENEIKQSKRMTVFSYKIKCFKSDGVYQLNEAVKQIIGVGIAREGQGPSGKKITVQTIDVQLADGSRVKVPYGDIELPGLGSKSTDSDGDEVEEPAMLTIGYDEGKHELNVRGKCQFRFAGLIDSMIVRTQELLSTQSIYKGVALEVTDLNEPKILDISDMKLQMFVMSEALRFQLNPVLSRILRPDECIKKNIPLKYGALFEGAYGTGKTLLAFKLGQQGLENGWSFVYLKEPKLLAETLRLVKTIDESGRGVIVFVEDLDQIARGNRTEAMQDILNTLDGGDTKTMNVITLFTTNHIELIEPTFLRGKRIGSVISMGYMDNGMAKDFINESFTAPEYTLAEGMESVYDLIAESNIVPAFMAEIVETVKSNMLFENSTEVKPEYIETAVNSYIRQMGLSKKKDMSETPEVRLANSLREVLKTDRIADCAGFLKAWISADADMDDKLHYQKQGDEIIKGTRQF